MSHRLRVDIIRCDGYGCCAELFPERVRADSWGYPVVDPAPFSGELIAVARRAVAACPCVALGVEPTLSRLRPAEARPAAHPARGHRHRIVTRRAGRPG